ncbi:MAG TPA: DUF2652 domain-containing protein [Chitinophagaceae bacterium]|nr:DUF2652 domain-containing protein [Chitinophagaceae bacterium]
MSTTSKIHSGFIIIADISGYTSFITGTELEHAQSIVEELTKLILGHIQPPLKMVKLEGDAVFYYVPAEMLPDAERLLEHIESCYYDFTGHLQKIKHLTSCQCRACSSIHTLDLKFFVHYGEYMIQRVPGTTEDIVGRDVILLHRLLKNTVTEKMGLRGYALFTNACLERMIQLSSITAHTETYEHIGEVQCGVYDLHAYEQKLRETNRVYLESKDADYIYERIMKASPELLWSFIIEPKKRVKWQSIKEVKNTHNSSGRLGVDAEFHCDHGSFSRFTRLLDWRPFHYMTNISVQSFHKLPFKAPPVQGIFEFIPVDAEHTKISMRTRSLRRGWFTMLIVRLFMKRMLDKENTVEFNKLDKIFEELDSSELKV